MRSMRLHLSEPQATAPAAPPEPMGRQLINRGDISSADLLHGLALQRHVDAPLGEILMAEGLVPREAVLQVLCGQHGAERVDLDQTPPDRGMRRLLPAALALQFRVVPWRKLGGRLLVATESPGAFNQLRACMDHSGLKLIPVIADRAQIYKQINRLYGDELARKAAQRVPARHSCRGWGRFPQRRRFWAGLVLLALAAALLVQPAWVLTILMLWAVLTLGMCTVLKAAALLALGRAPKQHAGPRPGNAPDPFRLPQVSVMVPLLREREIAGHLIERLSRLTYPKSLLDVILVLEEGDVITRETLARSDLPPWMSVIEVPEANQLTTKPRALNYALDFCKGSIIGVWDAEDAPEPDQIEKVVSRFQKAPAKVACLQGALDYYNSRDNWMSRCFTIEYAGWWRVVLPGIARLGLVIPLGGTTLFFRANVLKHLGGWDAHNVTEDADLGLRLAREGFVTELLPTVTHEEATCRPWPWVRQRSRWLKGFLVTWCVHMRAPGLLLKELGVMRFLGVQTLFLATFSQFLLAPLLWSFWLVPLGLPHPVAQTLGTGPLWTLTAVFITAEVLNLAVACAGVARPTHRHLLGWTLTMPLYFPLGTLAAFKAAAEFVGNPFWWDKTQHGVSGSVDRIAAAPRQVPKAQPDPLPAIPNIAPWVSVRGKRGDEAPLRLVSSQGHKQDVMAERVGSA